MLDRAWIEGESDVSGGARVERGGGGGRGPLLEETDSDECERVGGGLGALSAVGLIVSVGEGDSLEHC